MNVRKSDWVNYLENCVFCNRPTHDSQDLNNVENVLDGGGVVYLTDDSGSVQSKIESVTVDGATFYKESSVPSVK